MARGRWHGAVAAAVLLGVAACGGEDPPSATPATGTTPTAPATPTGPAVTAAPSDRLACPGELVRVTITDRYRYPRPPGTPDEALARQLGSSSYAEGDQTWGLPRDFTRTRSGPRSVTYAGRRADGTVAIELRFERQAEPDGWTPTRRRNCEPPRTPPTALQAAMPPGPDPQVTCDPGYRAASVVFDREPGPGSASARDALRAYLAVVGGRLSGDEVLTEDQFVELPWDADRRGAIRFAARRTDGSWAAVVDVRRPDGRWSHDGVATCARDEL